MTDSSPLDVTFELSAALEDFIDELGSAMTIGEFCEILALSLGDLAAAPVSWDSAVTVVPILRDGVVATTAASRVGELNDNLFVQFADLLAEVAGRHAGDGVADSRADVVLADVLAGLHRCDPRLLADVAPSDVEELKLLGSKRNRQAISSGDVVAIPVRDDRFVLAVVITTNSFGTAFGLLGDAPRVPQPEIPPSTGTPTFVYSDDSCVAQGTWTVVGHDENLLQQFPADPEIYHAPIPGLDDLELGEYGAAETSSGELRLLSRDEAEAVGLLDNSYEQVVLCAELQRDLAEEYAE